MSNSLVSSQTSARSFWLPVLQLLYSSVTSVCKVTLRCELRGKSYLVMDKAYKLRLSSRVFLRVSSATILLRANTNYDLFPSPVGLYCTYIQRAKIKCVIIGLDVVLGDVV